MNAMRIGIDARFYGGEQSKGLGRYTQRLVEYVTALDPAGKHEFVIFLQDEAYRSFRRKNSRVIPVRASYRWYTLAEQLWMPFRIARAHVDVMHFPHFNVPLLYRRPFIVTIHDLIIMHFPTERATTLGPYLYKLKHIAGQLVMRHAVRSSWKILTVSAFSKKDIVATYGIDPTKVIVTYEAADTQMPACILDDRSFEHRWKITKPFFLYVGNAYPHKNLEILLQAFARLRQRGPLPFQLVLVGRKDYFYGRLQQDAWARGLDEDVIFPGFVADRELSCFYEKALAYVFPSRYEGFGLPPLEAMQYGTPVLAANSSCLPEILGLAALSFEPTDISGIIKVMLRVFHEEELRDELVAKGYERVRQFSWERMAEQTLEVYEDFFQMLHAGKSKT